MRKYIINVFPSEPERLQRCDPFLHVSGLSGKISGKAPPGRVWRDGSGMSVYKKREYYELIRSFSLPVFLLVHTLDRKSINANTPKRTTIGMNETIVSAPEMYDRLLDIIVAPVADVESQ